VESGPKNGPSTGVIVSTRQGHLFMWSTFLIKLLCPLGTRFCCCPGVSLWIQLNPQAQNVSGPCGPWIVDSCQIQKRSTIWIEVQLIRAFDPFAPQHAMFCTENCRILGSLPWVKLQLGPSKMRKKAVAMPSGSLYSFGQLWARVSISCYKNSQIMWEYWYKTRFF